MEIFLFGSLPLGIGNAYILYEEWGLKRTEHFWQVRSVILSMFQRNRCKLGMESDFRRLGFSLRSVSPLWESDLARDVPADVMAFLFSLLENFVVISRLCAFWRKKRGKRRGKKI